MPKISAELLFRNANITTLDEKRPEATSVAVCGDRILVFLAGVAHHGESEEALKRALSMNERTPQV